MTPRTRRITARCAAVLVAGVPLLTLAAACGAAEGTSLLAADDLPTGKSLDWYWSRLVRDGYRVQTVSFDLDQRVEYEVVRKGRSWRIGLTLDADHQTVIDVDVTVLELTREVRVSVS